MRVSGRRWWTRTKVEASTMFSKFGAWPSPSEGQARSRASRTFRAVVWAS